MGVQTSKLGIPDESHERIRRILDRVLVPESGDFSSLSFYELLGKITRGDVRSVKTMDDLPLNPSFVPGKPSPQLFNTISRRELTKMPNVFTEEEMRSLKTAYALLQYCLNACVIILRPDSLGKDDDIERRLIRYLSDNTRRTKSSRMSTVVDPLQRFRNRADILAGIMVPTFNTTTRGNAYITFPRDANSRILMGFQSLLRKKMPMVSSEGKDISLTKTGETAVIFRKLLNNINTRTICGTSAYTGGTFLKFLNSNKNSHIDSLLEITSKVTEFIELSLGKKSETVITMLRWIQGTLASRHEIPVGMVPLGENTRILFAKSGETLRIETEKVCRSLGRDVLPQKDVVIKTTKDEYGTPVTDSSVNNSAAKRLYEKVSSKNNQLKDAAVKAFGSLFIVGPSRVPGSLNIPVSLPSDNPVDEESTKKSQEKTTVYLSVNPAIIKSDNPTGKIVDVVTNLIFAIAKTYDSIDTIFKGEDMRKIYGFV